jgi:glycosyltransferase involved in cell wall biosynthesis
MTPLVSIIIPTYNRAHLIEATLDSVMGQSYSNWECIIVDDGSTDKTNEVIAEYIKLDSRFQYHKRPSNRLKGPNACRNFGFEKSNGDFIHWFDSDDLYYPYALEKYIERFSENVDCVIAKTEISQLETGIFMKESKILSDDVLRDFFLGNVVYYVCGPMWKRTFLIKQNELFDTTIGRQDDWEFNMRMLINNPKIVYLEEVLNKYRKHKDSFNEEVTKLNKSEIDSHIKARKKIIKLLNERNINLNINYDKHLADFNLKVLKKSLFNKHKYSNLFLWRVIEIYLKRIDIIRAIWLIFIYSTFKYLKFGYSQFNKLMYFK